MSAFTAAEIGYLRSQPLMRFASASATGRPDVAPVVFEVDGDDIVTGGFDITHTVRFRNIQLNPRVSVVVDDLATMEPWSPRGIKIIGTAGTVASVEGCNVIPPEAVRKHRGPEHSTKTACGACP